jgi:hypothetical protein
LNSFGGKRPADNPSSGRNLSKRDAAVIRGNTLMPIRLKACLGETLNGLL